MEIETMYRYKLPIVIVIVNNSGIYQGLDTESFKEIRNEGDPTQTYVHFHNVYFWRFFKQNKQF